MIREDTTTEQRLTWLYNKVKGIAYLAQAAAEREDDILPTAEDGYYLIHDDLMECLEVIDNMRSQ